MRSPGFISSLDKQKEGTLIRAQCSSHDEMRPYSAPVAPLWAPCPSLEACHLFQALMDILLRSSSEGFSPKAFSFQAHLLQKVFGNLDLA